MVGVVGCDSMAEVTYQFEVNTDHLERAYEQANPCGAVSPHHLGGYPCSFPANHKGAHGNAHAGWPTNEELKRRAEKEAEFNALCVADQEKRKELVAIATGLPMQPDKTPAVATGKVVGEAGSYGVSAGPAMTGECLSPIAKDQFRASNLDYIDQQVRSVEQSCLRGMREAIDRAIARYDGRYPAAFAAAMRSLGEDRRCFGALLGMSAAALGAFIAAIPARYKCQSAWNEARPSDALMSASEGMPAEAMGPLMQAMSIVVREVMLT